MLLSLFFVSCGPKVAIRIEGAEKTPVLKIVEQEINTFFTSASNASCEFILRKDTAFTDGDFAYEIKKKGNGYEVTLTGSGETEISHALYSFLESLGYQFNLGGAVAPEKIDLAQTFKDQPTETVHPAIRWRGIRQHVNFPMDISSYPLEEAKEYLRNMLRLRFNKLAVHSYPLQWYKTEMNGETQYAGHFFYGNRHPIPDIPVMKDHIRFNKEYFVIPEIESVYLDEAKCSDAAIRWMQQLLDYAKEIGLTVSLSIEQRRAETLEDAVNTARIVAETYPMIDQLEFITEEMGGWGLGSSPEQLQATVIEQFGKEYWDSPLIREAVAHKNNDLENLFYQAGRNIRAIKTIQADPQLNARMPPITIGTYCSNPLFSRVVSQLYRQLLPDTEITIMPAHGSRNVNRNFRQAITDPDDMARTILYSWVEFDGLMFLQQNCIKGIHDVVEYIGETMGDRQGHALLFNHWRTEENRTAARYGALATLYGAIPETEFYGRMADELDLADKEAYTKGMKLLDEADWEATVKLPNIGFCWVGAWNGGGSYPWMDRNEILRIRDIYEEAGNLLVGAFRNTTSEAGRDYLQFLGNRTACTIVYLTAFEAGCAIQDIKPEKDGTYNEAQKAEYVQACNNALVIFDQYMKLHAYMLPDRGCEGTLINTWYAPVRGLKILRNKVGGIDENDPIASSTSETAPPLPIFYQE